MHSARRAFYRAAVLFGLTLLIVGFNPDLIPKITGFLTGRAPPGLARNGEIKVWAVTKSGLYYCPGVKAYSKLQPGTYMTEASAVPYRADTSHSKTICQPGCCSKTPR